MRYQGGKSRIAKQLAQVIMANVERERESNGALVSLFCGACSVESKLAPYFDKVICNDKHDYLISLYKAMQNGYIPPDYITEEEYNSVKNNIDKYPKEYVGFVGFGSSFGGKWFGSYGRSKKPNGERRWHSQESKKALLRDMKILQNAEFICQDYRDVIIPKGSVVYCDPPYDNTTPYSGIEKFNSQEFWEYMRKISKDNLVFISEQKAPDDFECIWEKPFTRTLDRNKDNQFNVTEKLFTYKNSKYAT